MGTRPGDRIADELAGLRQVAVLVAGGAPSEEISAAVTAEIRRLLAADLTAVARYEPGEIVTTVGAWSGAGITMPSGVRSLSKAGCGAS